MPPLPRFPVLRRAVCVPVVVGILLIALAAVPHRLDGTQSRARPFVAIFVVDGLRPDAISPEGTPTLDGLRRAGAEYRHSHAVFPTVTRLNTATLVTGAYPARHGIVANSMFVPAVDNRAPFDTGDHRALLTLEAREGRAITTETLGEVLQRAGRRLVTVSSGSTGNGYLLNPMAGHGAGAAINGVFERGVTAAYPQDVNAEVLRRFGAAPPDPDDLGQMQWTDTVLREYVIPELQPDVVIDWMGPLDSTQHASGVASPAARQALAAIDRSLADTLATLARHRPDANVIVTSDHGFAHHAAAVDVVGALVAAGLKQSRSSTDIVVASQSQSVLFYVERRDARRIGDLVRFLQASPWADVIFTAGTTGVDGGMAGTFSFDLIHARHPTRAADVIATLSWSNAPNAFGASGSQTVNGGTTGPLTGAASGHGGLAPWVVRNTFIAHGPAFKAGVVLDAPMSLADVMPTVLTMLGMPVASGPDTGRILREVLAGGPSPTTRRRTVRTSAGPYAAELTLSAVDGHEYVDTGRRVVR